MVTSTARPLQSVIFWLHSPRDGRELNRRKALLHGAFALRIHSPQRHNDDSVSLHCTAMADTTMSASKCAADCRCVRTATRKRIITWNNLDSVGVKCAFIMGDKLSRRRFEARVLQHLNLLDNEQMCMLLFIGKDSPAKQYFFLLLSVCGIYFKPTMKHQQA